MISCLVHDAIFRNISYIMHLIMHRSAVLVYTHVKLTFLRYVVNKVCLKPTVACVQVHMQYINHSDVMYRLHTEVQVGSKAPRFTCRLWNYVYVYCWSHVLTSSVSALQS